MAVDGSVVKGELDEFQEGFQNKEVAALGDDPPPLHSQEACSHSRILKVSKSNFTTMNSTKEHLKKCSKRTILIRD